MSVGVLVHVVKCLWLILSRYHVLGTYENMSPESSSSLFPDRPIRPLPKRRLRERISPDVADSIKYPPAPQAIPPLFVYPYNSQEESLSFSTDPVGVASRDNRLRPEGHTGFRRNGLVVNRDDDSLIMQARRALGSRGFHEPAEHGTRVPARSGQPRQPKPQPPPSTASSADGYDSFENTNNKKKRKIPIAGETILNGTHVLNEPAAFGMPSPPGTVDDDSGDHVPTSTPYYQSGGPLSNGQGISGPGRGRYGRIRNGRSPLRALSDSNANWTGRSLKLRAASQYPSPPAGKYESASSYTFAISIPALAFTFYFLSPVAYKLSLVISWFALPVTIAYAYSSPIGQNIQVLSLLPLPAPRRYPCQQAKRISVFCSNKYPRGLALDHLPSLLSRSALRTPCPGRDQTLLRMVWLAPTVLTDPLM